MARTRKLSSLFSLALLGGATLLCPSLARAGDGAQVTRGAIDYSTHCMKCHGAAGKGKKNYPAVVGENALPLDPPPGAKLRTGQFRTAKDVLDFITANMPLHKGGKLKPEVYEAILAFDLKANGIDLGDKKINPETAAQIKLHP